MIFQACLWAVFLWKQEKSLLFQINPQQLDWVLSQHHQFAIFACPVYWMATCLFYFHVYFWLLFEFVALSIIHWLCITCLFPLQRPNDNMIDIDVETERNNAVVSTIHFHFFTWSLNFACSELYTNFRILLFCTSRMRSYILQTDQIWIFALA